MPTAKGKQTIGAEADTQLVKALDDRAKAEGRSRSETILRAVRFFLKYAKLQPDSDTPEPAQSTSGKQK